MQLPSEAVPEGIAGGAGFTIPPSHRKHILMPMGCVLGGSYDRDGSMWYRVSCEIMGLETGSKVSMGCIKGVVQIVEEIDGDCDMVLSSITFMKKGSTGIVHESMCHRLGLNPFKTSPEE